jgi:hypothetical protein
MAERNGVDIAAVLELVATLAADVREMRAEMRAFMIRTDERIASLQADVRDLKREVASIRDELRLFTATVQGHGILLTEHDERIGRLERSA